MKNIMFDTGPIISLTLNELLWLLKELNDKYEGDFLIPEVTKRELIDKPMSGKKFRFEAIRVNDLINEKVLRIYKSKEATDLGDKLLNIGNSCFNARSQDLKIVHRAEMHVLSAAIVTNSDAVVIDERTTRNLIEEPESLRKHLSRKLHTTVKMNKKKISEFRKLTKNIKVLRSSELLTLAYEFGLLEKYVEASGVVDEKMAKKLLSSALWALKLSGCAITKEEIDKVVALETKKLKKR